MPSWRGIRLTNTKPITPSVLKTNILHKGMLLSHAEVPYDPAKAHEYYLRNRELKGSPTAKVAVRTPTKAAAKPISPAMRAQIAKVAADKAAKDKASAAALVKQVAAKKAPVKLSKAMTAEVRKQAILANVKLLQEKFNKLKDAYELLLRQAKERSGVTTPTDAAIKKEAEAAAAKSTTPAKELTPAQKSEKAKAAAKKYAEDNKDVSADQQLKAINDKIAEIQLKVKKFHAKQAAEAAVSKKVAAKKAPANKVPTKASDKKNPVPVGVGIQHK